MKWFVYILECCDGSYYVGHAHDVLKRLKQHNAKMGAKWTAQRVPVKVVYTEEYCSESEAVDREKQLKGWSKAKKGALINANYHKLKELSRCRKTHPINT